jgi:hypothetical protein
VIKLSWDNRTTRFKNYDATAQAPGEIESAFGGGGGGGGGRTWTHSTVPDVKPGLGGGEPPPFETGDGFGEQYGGGGQGNASEPPTYRGFSPGKKTGPIENHRDGGGPDADDDEIPI